MRPAIAAIAAIGLGLLSACVPQARPVVAEPEPEIAPATAAGRGAILVEAHCGSCHAVSRTGDSPLTAAPPLRQIVSRYPPEMLEEAFAEGVVTGHAAMPAFAFSPEEIEALTAYLRTLED